MTRAGVRSPAQATVVATGATVMSVLPMYIAGAMAVQLTSELAIGTAGLGIAVGAYRGTTAATATYLGAQTDRFGATTSLRVAAVVIALTCLGIAATATSLATLTAWMMVGGAGLAVAQPAANRLLVNTVPPARQGLAFGFKQAAMPGATMLAGISVPLIGLTLGWRWAFVCGSLVAVAVLAAIGRRRTPPPARAARGEPQSSTTAGRRGPLVVFAVAFGLGNLANSGIPVFYVDATVRAGRSASFAGALLAAASAASILTRILTGWGCDRMTRGHFQLCAGMIALGSAGLGLLATEQPVAMAAGVVIGLAGTWGFNAVFWFAIMRAFADAPGAATGVVAPGGHIGGTAGPVLLGVIAQGVSYRAAWAAAGAMAILAALGMALGARTVASRGRVG